MPPKKGFKHSPETCRKYSESKKGEKNPMFGKHTSQKQKEVASKTFKGKPRSEETRKRMSEAQKKIPHKKGYKRPKEVGKRISDGRRGIVFSEEHIKNLSESHKGKTLSPEGRKKISEYNKSHPEVIERLRKIRCAKPSKPQLLLFETIKALYPEEIVEPEWKVETSLGRRHIDVAIPSLMIGFEYDEPAYHGLYWGSKEKDLERHNAIEALGWKLIHYSNISQFPKEK